MPGLYFIGEVVDVTGHLGGYNFQWAWASGYAAGQVLRRQEQKKKNILPIYHIKFLICHCRTRPRAIAWCYSLHQIDWRFKRTTA